MRLLLLLLTAPVFAALTPDQKLADFQYLAGLYNKSYAPYEWKKAVFGFDALDIAPWLARVSKTANDLEFYELCIEYVSSLHDSHDVFTLPSDFVASLGFTVDIYDGKVLIDSIDRNRLRATTFPFQTGDELVSVDDVAVEDLIRNYSVYAMQGNTRSMRRRAASRIVTRPQSRMPKAATVGENATIVVRRENGDLETYTVPWIKTGAPLVVGPIPAAKNFAVRTAESDEPANFLKQLHTALVPTLQGELGSGALRPVFNLPSDFVQRLGRTASDTVFSGTYRDSGYRIGFLRIPSYGGDPSRVLSQIAGELAFFQQNTDALVIDQTRNPGGDPCLAESIATFLVPYPFESTGYELRATWALVAAISQAVEQARAARSPQWTIDLLQMIMNTLKTAYDQNRGRTGPVPICSASPTRLPATDSRGNSLVYTKPFLVLNDEFTASAADSFAAMLQDAERGVLFGLRTNGAGGLVSTYIAGAYTEGVSSVTLGMMTRRNPVATGEFPTAPYIENIGVYPHVYYDYMTRENLVRNGKPFVDAFTATIVDVIQQAAR